MPTNLKLKKPTPGAMRVYKEHGILDEDQEDQRKNAMARIDLYSNEEALKEVLAVTFEDEFTGDDYENLDLSAVGVGIQNFLASLFVPSGRSGPPNKSS